MKLIQSIFFIFLISLCISSFGQKTKVTFGLQYKPILPLKVLNVEDLVIDENGYNATLSPTLGHNFGGIIRWGFTDKIALESGLSYVRRNFDMDITLNDTLSGKGDFGIVQYEIPFQGLFYVRLSKRYYMNAATGFSFNFRASDVGNRTENKQFTQTTSIQGINMAYLANIGFEYRSKKSGTFYLGASLTTPFRPLGKITLYSEDLVNVKTVSGLLSGNYISVDIRYFFQDTKKKNPVVQ